VTLTRMHLDAVKLFYEESKSARKDLDDLCDRYHSNTTIVLALATGATTLFGFSNSVKGTLFVLAIVTYGIGASMALTIYWPVAWKYNVAHDVDAKLQSIGDKLTLGKMYYDLARGHQEAIDVATVMIGGKGGKGKWFRGISGRFRVLVGMATLTVIFAAIDVSVTHPGAPDKPTRIVIVKE
jgi:hypothetical protein